MEKKKTEQRRADAGMLYSDASLGKILEIRADAEIGVCEAYLTKWDTVDSWNTSFRQGAFKNTFSKRGAGGTRLIWNHGELAGKILELREDSYGPLAKVQFNLETDAGKKAYAHVRAGDVSCFSFGFNTIKDAWIGQTRQITEVDMLECGPVVFEANNAAKITDVRSGDYDKAKEERATDFDETQAKIELNAKGWQLLSSLEWTIDDIYYQGGNPSPETVIAEVDTAIAKFHTAYIDWLNAYYDQYESREGKAPCEHRNHLQRVVNSLDTEDLIKSTALTSAEVESLAKGCLLPVEERGKLLAASPILAKAHQETRSKLIESLCDELRHSGVTGGEAERIEALITIHKNPSEVDAAIDLLREIRSKF